jgi:hypothetical protein
MLDGSLEDVKLLVAIAHFPFPYTAAVVLD